MGQDKKATHKRLTELLINSETKRLPLEGSKYMIISDIHLGDGKSADDFRDNVKALQAALTYYDANDYKLILLGDIEEMWQFDLFTIEKRYDNKIYKYIRRFGNDRVLRVFGNHDIEWAYPKDPIYRRQIRTNIAKEALILEYNSKPSILMVHGHQGSTESDKFSWLSRIAVKGFKYIESAAKFLGFYGHKSVTKSQVAMEYEQIFYSWAKQNKTIIICGHSHRAIFASISYAMKLNQMLREAQLRANEVLDDKTEYKKRKKVVEKILDELMDESTKSRDIDPSAGEKTPLPCYFNDGCALYSDGITNIEIDNGQIRLIKWDNAGKRSIYEKGSLHEYINKVCI